MHRIARPGERCAPILVLMVTMAACPLAAFASGTPSFSEPGISPDGTEIAFVSGGDIWTVPTGGGQASLLVSHPATEARPLWSPDGRHLAFQSTRTGNGDVYVLTPATGELRRLTHDEAPALPTGWSPDGTWVYFTSSGRDIAGMNDVFRVRRTGGTPMAVAADRFANEFDASPSPDGRTLALARLGISSDQWWRRGSSHIDTSELWLMNVEGDPSHRPLATAPGARQKWPLWLPGGDAVVFVSDRGGAENLWLFPLGGEPRPLTPFTDGRVLWPTMSGDGVTVAFERNLEIWLLDMASGRTAPVAIQRRGVPAAEETERLQLTSGFEELALSPDGKKLALVVRGEVFAVGAKEGGDAVRVTTTPGPEAHLAWAPDSRRLAFTSFGEDGWRLRLHDFSEGKGRFLTAFGEGDAVAPVFSPDGSHLAYLREGRELRVMELGTGQDRLLAEGDFPRMPLAGTGGVAWSPDSRFLAYLTTGEHLYTNAWVVAAAGGDPQPASALANTFGRTVRWSSDGTFLLFATGQRTEDGRVARVDLTPEAPVFREDAFRDLFRQETPGNGGDFRTDQASPSGDQDIVSQGTVYPHGSGVRPVAITWEGLLRRVSLLPVGLDVESVVLNPDGDAVLLQATAAGRSNLWLFPLDRRSREEPVPRQLTSTTGEKRAAHFSPDGKEVWFLDDGKIGIVTVDSKVSRSLAVSAVADSNPAGERLEVWRQVHRYLRDHFYDPGFHGLDWDVTANRYRSHAAGAANRRELARVLSLMVGELNASHLGVKPAVERAKEDAGRVGVFFDRSVYETQGRLRVTEVIPLGPAHLAGGIAPGDVLVAVNGTPLDGNTNFDALLLGTRGRRTELTVETGDSHRTVAVRPVSQAAEGALLYRDWVERNREYVERASGGRLGYVHMADMGWGSLQRLYQDLDARAFARQGVVIDLRHNNGGFVNVYAIDVFARREYLTMTPRGSMSAPARSVLGQRALGKPTALVINRHSLSDAEDFTEGYRTLGLGPVIGEPTAGWIIYTWNARLSDGTVVRLPRMRVDDARGENMELAPRPVDVQVGRPPGEGASDRDSQLDAAVAELLARLPVS